MVCRWPRCHQERKESDGVGMIAPKPTTFPSCQSQQVDSERNWESIFVSSYLVNASPTPSSNVFVYEDISVCRYSVGRLGSNSSDKRQSSALHSLVIVSC